MQVKGNLVHKESPEQSDKSFFLGVVRAQKTKPILLSTFVGMDLFEWKKLVYLIIMDYYSGLIEKAQLDRTTTETVILCCKNMFSKHGIPEEVVMDNRSQFDSNALRKFSYEYHFCHITSNPYFPRSNGEAE